MNIDYDKLWEELAGEVGEQNKFQKLEGEKSLFELAQLFGISRSSITPIINELIKEGKLKKREVTLPSGRMFTYFSPVIKE